MFTLRHYWLIFNFTAHYKNFIPYNNIYSPEKKKSGFGIFQTFIPSILTLFLLFNEKHFKFFSVLFQSFFPISLIGKLSFSIVFTAFFSPILSSFLCSGTYSSFFITNFDFLFPSGWILMGISHLVPGRNPYQRSPVLFQAERMGSY